MTEQRTPEEKMQFDNPSAPNYDWQQDREWFNQRLAKQGIRNAALHNRILALRTALKSINSQKAKAALREDDAAIAVQREGTQ